MRPMGPKCLNASLDPGLVPVEWVGLLHRASSSLCSSPLSLVQVQRNLAGPLTALTGAQLAEQNLVMSSCSCFLLPLFSPSLSYFYLTRSSHSVDIASLHSFQPIYPLISESCIFSCSIYLAPAPPSSLPLGSHYCCTKYMPLISVSRLPGTVHIPTDTRPGARQKRLTSLLALARKNSTALGPS